MSRPLYQGLAPSTAIPGHAGLWYEKYCDQWRITEGALPKWDLKAKDKRAPKADWINTVVAGSHSIGSPVEKLLTEHHARLASLCTPGHSMQQVFSTTSRLVIGMGQDHPVENGFLWHPTLGVPYIPGSSIKGMLRNWLLAWEGRSDMLPWFETAAKGAGELVFLDALPTRVPALEADVITPHYGPYYQDPANTPPADWHSPIPTPFLTVKTGASFAVRVLLRRCGTRQVAEQQVVDFAVLRQSLQEAFDITGIGAKTAVGYGRLTPAKDGATTSAPADSTDPLAEFKSYCTGFGTIASNKGRHGLLVQKLNDLPPSVRPAALAYLRDGLKTKAKDCAGGLKTLLFP